MRNGLDDIGARLRETRRRWGYSQRDLAHVSGVGSATVHRLEDGQFEPRLSTIRQLADVLQVRVEWLLTGDIPMVGVHQMTTDAQMDIYARRPVSPDHPSAYIVSPGGPWRHPEHDPDGWEIDPAWTPDNELETNT